MKTVKFEYQKLRKKTSEYKILLALQGESCRSFTEIMNSTGLSKPILSNHLKELTKRRLLRLIPDYNTRRFFYKLDIDSLDRERRIKLYLSNYTKNLLEQLVADSKSSSINDEDYITKLRKNFGSIVFYKLLMMSDKERRNWIKDTFDLITKNVLPKERINELQKIVESLYPEEREFYYNLISNHDQ